MTFLTVLLPMDLNENPEMQAKMIDTESCDRNSKVSLLVGDLRLIIDISSTGDWQVNRNAD